MSSDIVLEGKWAVVTGGSKGIGFEIAGRLVDAGASVIIIGRGAEALADARAALWSRARLAAEVRFVVGDMADPGSLEAVFAEFRRSLPRLDIFVANAGTGGVGAFLDFSIDEWRSIVELNLTGTFLGCQAAARMMRDSDDPTSQKAILVVSSIRATSSLPGRVAYSASKAAVNQLVRVAARELAPLGIRVNALSPGITETPLTRANFELFEEAASMVPLGRAGLPADMAEAALFLCSDRASYITGANLVVDGGESLI
jgi:glucose 1-dehydrogenase